MNSEQKRSQLERFGTPADPDGRPSTCPVCRRLDAYTLEHGCVHGCSVDAALAAGHHASESRAVVTPLDELNRQLEKFTRRPFGANTTTPRVLAAEKHGKRGALFVYKLADGRELTLHGAAELTSRAKFQAAVADQLGLMIATPAKEHQDFAALMLSVVEEIDTSDQDTSDLHGWVSSFMHRRALPIVHLDDREQLASACDAGISFATPGGELYLVGDEFAKYIRREFSEQIRKSDLNNRLSALGFTSERLYARRTGNPRPGKSPVAKRYFWRITLADLGETAADRGVPVPTSIHGKRNTSRGDSGDTGTRIEDGPNPQTTAGDDPGTHGDTTTPGGAL